MHAHPTLRRGLTVGFILFAAACGGPAQIEPAPPAADSLVKLIRKNINEPDPVPTFLAIVCEMHHLTERYGDVEGSRLICEGIRVAHADADRGAMARRNSKLGGHNFPGGEAACTTHPDSTRPVRRPR